MIKKTKTFQSFHSTLNIKTFELKEQAEHETDFYENPTPKDVKKLSLYFTSKFSSITI